MRAQAHTLEATVAALLLLASLIFALQMTAVTPLSASTSSQHIENQQGATAQGVLSAAAENDGLKQAILYWNNTSAQFHEIDSSLSYYTTGPPNNTTFGRMLDRSFNERGIAYNVYFRANQTEPTDFIYSGVPSDNAIRATYTVTLMDNDTLYNADGTANETQLYQNVTGFPIGDADTDGPLYNTVRVEVVAWRI